MAKLNRIAMDLIRRSNKPENLKGIVDNGYANDYAKYLISVGDKLPDIIIDGVLKNTTVGNLPVGPSFIELVIKMKAKGMEVPEDFIKRIQSNATSSTVYAVELLRIDLVEEIEPEIYNVISDSGVGSFNFFRKLKDEEITDISPIPDDVLLKMVEKMASFGTNPPQTTTVPTTNAEFCYNIIHHLVKKGSIKSFKQIDPKIIDYILNVPSLVEPFVHFISPYVKELPENIKSKLKNSSAFKPDWKKVQKFDESFSSWFNKK